MIYDWYLVIYLAYCKKFLVLLNCKICLSGSINIIIIKECSIVTSSGHT